jgi:signal transduction histidine kinase
VATDRSLMSRAGRIDPVAVDRVVAAAGLVGALLDASSQPHTDLDAIAVASLAVLMGSVAWRRADPVVSTVTAISGLIAFVLASGYNGGGSFQAAAIALNFYLLGQRGRTRRRMALWAGVFGYWLVAAVVINYAPPGSSGSVGPVLGAWSLFGPLPFAFGWTLAIQGELTGELAQHAERLDAEQTVRAQRAAIEERNRVARELHDVIAHCLSVMVVQTSAARLLASTEIDASRDALAVVESAGRDALVELRRIVGVLRRERDQLAADQLPGLSQLGILVERAQAAALPVDLNIDGPIDKLSPSLDLVAYRLVQEALTNAIKHAGPATAQVSIRVDDDQLELLVSDTGRGPRSGQRHDDGSGQGLVGMHERVALYGGEFRTAARPGGGFEVRARMPLHGSLPAPAHETVPTGADPRVADDRGSPPSRWPWLDPLLAGVLLVLFEIELLAGGHRRGPMALNVVVVAGLALAVLIRRRAPFLFAFAVGGLVVSMQTFLVSIADLPLIGTYFLIVPAYSVAAWATRAQAAVALVLMVGGTMLSAATSARSSVADVGGALLVIVAAWVSGWLISRRRATNTGLGQTARRLVAEREDRARLATAGERSRIARELHGVVARSVASMVVQAEAGRAQLDRDPTAASLAMETLEQMGRATLAEMRRILGVLRHSDDRGELAPRPGVDQIYTLIQRARADGQQVELTVNGDLGTLAAGLDLAIYRIVEDTLENADTRPGATIRVALDCGDGELALSIQAPSASVHDWPTDVIRERVALCGGELSARLGGGEISQLIARLPRDAQGALT